MVTNTLSTASPASHQGILLRMEMMRLQGWFRDTDMMVYANIEIVNLWKHTMYFQVQNPTE